MGVLLQGASFCGYVPIPTNWYGCQADRIPPRRADVGADVGVGAGVGGSSHGPRERIAGESRLCHGKRGSESQGGSMKRLEGKVAWVTGAGSGIGEAGALALGQEGA